MTRLTETERLVAVETNLQNLTSAVQGGFADTKESIQRLNEKIEQLTPTLVTETRHAEDMAALRKEITEIKAKRWIQNTLSAILGSVLALLIAFFINNIGRG